MSITSAFNTRCVLPRLIPASQICCSSNLEDPRASSVRHARYFTQAVGEDDPGRKDLLFDIATEELSHLEIVEQRGKGSASRSG